MFARIKRTSRHGFCVACRFLLSPTGTNIDTDFALAISLHVWKFKLWMGAAVFGIAGRGSEEDMRRAAIQKDMGGM